MGIRVDNFSPSYNYTISASTTSAPQALTQNTVPGGNPIVDLAIKNATGSVAFVRWGKGTQTATTSDYAILPGTAEVIKMSSAYDNVAVILASGTGSVYLSLGEGS